MAVATGIFVAAITLSHAAPVPPELVGVSRGRDSIAFFRIGGNIVAEKSGDRVADFGIVGIDLGGVTLCDPAGHRIVLPLGNGSTTQSTAEVFYALPPGDNRNAPRLGPAGWKILFGRICPAHADEILEAFSGGHFALPKLVSLQMTADRVTIEAEDSATRQMRVEVDCAVGAWVVTITENGAARVTRSTRTATESPEPSKIRRDDVAGALDAVDPTGALTRYGGQASNERAQTNSAK